MVLVRSRKKGSERQPPGRSPGLPGRRNPSTVWGFVRSGSNVREIRKAASYLSVPEGTVNARPTRARAQMAGHVVDREEADHV